jgi:hypothetical protein
MLWRHLTPRSKGYFMRISTVVFVLKGGGVNTSRDILIFSSPKSEYVIWPVTMSIRISQKFRRVYTQECRSHGGSWGNCNCYPNSVGAVRGKQVALFTGTACTSKFVRYSQQWEFITIFKQCLSNLCLIFNQL